MPGGLVCPEECMNLLVQLLNNLFSLPLINSFVLKPMYGNHSRIHNNDKTMVLYVAVFHHC